MWWDIVTELSLTPCTCFFLLPFCVCFGFEVSYFEHK